MGLVMNKKYITNFDPETETFTLQDNEENLMIVISKEQLEEIIKLYKRCY